MKSKPQKKQHTTKTQHRSKTKEAHRASQSRGETNVKDRNPPHGGNRSCKKQDMKGKRHKYGFNNNKREKA